MSQQYGGYAPAEVLELLEALSEYAQVTKISSTFIPAFEQKSLWHNENEATIHGSFNITGTKSGRWSSSDPNLQTIPSTGTKYAKPIKQCIAAPDDWLFVGADFHSLEDMISALQTKDPNKLRVYQEGYDGHCLRAYSYFKEQMPDIENNVESINSIATKYKNLRQDSKAPTFALTYQGTWKALVRQCGFPETTAQTIEQRFHELYSVSREWVRNKLLEASQRGYVELAFGLRLRTPTLGRVVMEAERSMPFEAHKEGKTAGNALTQSYGMLTARATNEFMERVWDSEYAEQIMPAAQIHDAAYFQILNDIEVLHWTNKNLIECMKWQELPDIKHDQVKLGAALDLYYPTWNEPHTIPNDISLKDLEIFLKERKLL